MQGVYFREAKLNQTRGGFTINRRIHRPLPAVCKSGNKTGQAFRPGLLWWSCRESNPGPTAFPQDFSVRSSLCLYLDLLLTRTSQDDDPSHCLMSR
jgi:hypothetical protein